MGAVDITVIDHPLAAERLTILREASTPNAEFRAALDGLAGMLVYEATRLLPSQEVQVTTPLGPAYGRRLSTVPMLVPILRAGVGLVNGALRLLPSAEVGFVGLARDEETFLPSPYLAKLPDRLEERPCFVLDPMLATGGSLEYTCRLLVERGAPQPITVVCVLAAPEGLDRIRRSGIQTRIITAAIDSHLNDKAYIVPGLGDAGDRQFGLWWHSRGRAPPVTSAAEPGEDGQHAAVLGVRGRQPEPPEDGRDVLLDGAVGHDERLGDARVRPALRHERQHLPLAWRQRVQRSAAATGQQLRHHLGVQHRSAAGHAVDGIDEVGDVGHPLLEEVADRLRVGRRAARWRSAPRRTARARAPASPAARGGARWRLATPRPCGSAACGRRR